MFCEEHEWILVDTIDGLDYFECENCPAEACEKSTS